MTVGPDDPTRTETANYGTPLEGVKGAERFSILRRLGEGGMAVVYEAIDTKLGEKRALKFPKKGHGRSIPPEARAALRVTHENVCRVFEIHTAESTEESTDFISMEFVEGETLAARWRRKALSQAEALEIARQLCRGVMAAHGAKVLHLDLKSANVMLAGTRVVVMDFGLAQAFGEATRFAGTPNYIAPERYRGAEPTTASDLFAVGVILYEMLAGRLPADGVPPSKAGKRVVDKHWDPIVLRCLEPDPAKRTATAGELLAAIDRVFTPSNRRRWMAAAAVAVAVAGGLYAFREQIWPEPPLARLAVLPMTGSTGDKQLDETMAGGLAEVAGRLDSLGAASRRLVLIQPEEAARLKVDTAAKASGQLGATHVLVSSAQAKGKLVGLHAEVRTAGSGDLVKAFDGVFPVGELAGISTSLAGVVTSAFRLGKALPAQVKPEAYSFYAAGLGLVGRDRVSYERALALFDTALEVDGNSPLILAGRAQALLQKYRGTKDEQWLREAAQAAGKAAQLHPDSPQVLMALGDVAQAEGRLENAVSNYERAGALEPGRWETWSRLGLALVRMGKDQEAVLAARRAIELAPGYFAPHQTLGNIHFQRGRFAEAAKAYRTVTELAPLQPEGFSSFGGALLAAENEAEAEKALRRSVELRETLVALNNLGALLRYQRRDAEAAEVFARSLLIDRKDTMLRMNLANVLQRLGKTAEARVHFQQAGELTRAALLRNPGDAKARAQLAYVQVHTGSREAGLDNALQAARLDPNNYSVLLWATITLERIGKRELAVPMLRAATPQQLRDLRKQPDLQLFVRDPNYQQYFLETKRK